MEQSSNPISPGPSKIVSRFCMKRGSGSSNDSLEVIAEYEPKGPVARMSTSRINRVGPRFGRLVYNRDKRKLSEKVLREADPYEFIDGESQTSFNTVTLSDTSSVEDQNSDITILTPDEYETENAAPVEIIDYIEIFEEDDIDENYKNISISEMICEVCDRQFKVRPIFSVHHRRHIAQDHFQCPTCLQGFTSLKLCTSHEVRAHKKKPMYLRFLDKDSNNENNYIFQRELSPSLSSSSSLVSGQSGGTNMGEHEYDGDFTAADSSKRVIPSNCLIGYRGPSVEHPSQCFDIELKNQLKNRGSWSSVYQQIRSIRDHYLIIGDKS